MRPITVGQVLTAIVASAAATTSIFSATSTTLTSVTGSGIPGLAAVTAAVSTFSNASSTDDGTRLVGTAASTTANATTTVSSVMPTNTLPCNGYPELCNRKYSNITFVGAHNSPFDLPNNVASNQLYGVIPQLNDGVRMLQAQVHPVNGTLHMCHTDCSLLDAGPLEDYLANITQWLGAEENKLEVVSILLGNADYIGVGNFTAPIIDSGLIDYAFVPPKVPMTLDDWPTLGQIILNGNKRALIFMDYEADQSKVNYIMDEFSQVWETPFDPTDDSFPCVVNRPPGLNDTDARDRLYVANHNLNSNFSAFGLTIDIPNLSAINQTNALSGHGSLGLAANNCRVDWGRTPNFLFVDFYNYGDFPGSVFQVAAEANNLTYIKGDCCGVEQEISGAVSRGPQFIFALLAPALVVIMSLSW